MTYTALKNLMDEPIQLNPGHIYSYDKDKDISFSSVTEVIDTHFKPFDSKMIAGALVKNTQKYAHYSSGSELEAEWDRLRDRASEVHSQIEKYINDGKDPSAQRAKLAVDWFKKQKNKYGKEAYAEVIVFNDKSKVSGTVDLLVYHPDKEGVYIFDWKTTRDLYKSRGKGITSITNDVRDTKFEKGQLQLSMYRLLLNQLGIKVIRSYLLHLTEDGVELVQCKYLKSQVNQMIKRHKLTKPKETVEEDYWDDTAPEEDIKYYHPPQTRKIYSKQLFTEKTRDMMGSIFEWAFIIFLVWAFASQECF